MLANELPSSSTSSGAKSESKIPEWRRRDSETPLPSSSWNTQFSHKSRKLKILSWNLDGLDLEDLKERTDAVIETILKEKYDIILFQELICLNFIHLAEDLGKANYKLVIGKEKCPYFTGIFVRTNILKHLDHYIIPFENSTMGRNLLVAKFSFGETKLAVLNTHLESMRDHSAVRVEQLKKCFQTAASFPPDYNVIFGGDLNIRDFEIDGILPERLKDLWVECGSKPRCQYTWDLQRNTNKEMPSKFQPRCRFDRLFFQPATPSSLKPIFFGLTGTKMLEDEECFPSDHFGIFVVFEDQK